ncbi:MAG: UDP-glucose/GDP-mannose dehydrogenase family protein [archaeon]
MNLQMIGTGYVGLVSGACFAECGHDVTCVDTDKDKIAMLDRGEMPIYEVGLEAMVRRNVEAGRLHFSEKLAPGADAYFICVGTPESADGSADLSFVYAVAKQLGQIIDDEAYVVDKSTVPVGTGREVEKIIQSELDERGLSVPFSVVSCPEFLREGMAIHDFMEPDRVVIGTTNKKAKKVMEQIYRSGKIGEHLERSSGDNEKLIFMGRESAEITKYAANTFLANRIALINEFSRLCTVTGANIADVARGVGSDSRIGPQFLQAGHGYGGSCFPKDVEAVDDQARKRGIDANIISAISRSNDAQKFVLPEMMKYIYGEKMQGKEYALWGLTFKANTDDIREASALSVIQRLAGYGANLRVTDPEGLVNAQKWWKQSGFRTIAKGNVTFSEDQYEILDNADALILSTEWAQFYNGADWSQVKDRLKEPVIFDGKNICAVNPELRQTLTDLGFTVYSVGIPAINPLK